MRHTQPLRRSVRVARWWLGGTETMVVRCPEISVTEAFQSCRPPSVPLLRSWATERRLGVDTLESGAENTEVLRRIVENTASAASPSPSGSGAVPYQAQELRPAQSSLAPSPSPFGDRWVLHALLALILMAISPAHAGCEIIKSCCGDQFSLCFSGNESRTVEIQRVDTELGWEKQVGWGQDLYLRCHAPSVAPFKSDPLPQAGCAVGEGQLWSGCAWRPCVVGMSGDLLMLSSRLVEEARLMENAKVSVQDGTYASVALDHCDPLQRDMWKLADQAKELRECLSSTTFSSDRSAPAPKAAPEAQAALRARLAVPKGVPMYTLSPCASGHDLHDEVFMGLGLHAAKASLVAEKRVDVLKTKFESSKRSSGGDCLVPDLRGCSVQDLVPNARIYSRLQTTCLDESMNSNWSQTVDVITRPGCTWTFDSSIQGADANPEKLEPNAVQKLAGYLGLYKFSASRQGSWACANKSGCETHQRHGWVTVEAIDYVKLQKVLHDAGFHVLAYDLRNHGESEKKLPSGFGEIDPLALQGRCLKAEGPGDSRWPWL
eukprot:g9580.t1